MTQPHCEKRSDEAVSSYYARRIESIEFIVEPLWE